MPFWEGVSTDRYREVEVIRNFEDLDMVFTEGMRISIEMLKGDLYRHGMNVIPRTHCKTVKEVETR